MVPPSNLPRPIYNNRRGDIIGSSVSLHMCNTGSRCLACSVSGTAQRYTPGHLERGCWRLVRTRCPEGSRATWCRPHSCPGRWTGNKVWSGAAAHCTLCHPHVPTAAGQHEVADPHTLSCEQMQDNFVSKIPAQVAGHWCAVHPAPSRRLTQAARINEKGRAAENRLIDA